MVRMLQRRIAFMAGLAAVLVNGGVAAGQSTGNGRVFVDVNAGVQEGNTRFAVETPLPAFGRQGTLTVDGEITGGGVFDAGALVRVHGDVALGAGYSRTSSGEFMQYVAVVPPPVGSSIPPATFTDITSELRHEEQVVYVKAAWLRAPTSRFVYVVSAGPAFFRVKQDIPFTTAVLVNILSSLAPTNTPFTESTVGFHVGLDLIYMARHLGGGVLLRYTRGSVEFPSSTEPLTVGGAQLGIGVRARF
jgi:hypothetical protein